MTAPAIQQCSVIGQAGSGANCSSSFSIQPTQGRLIVVLAIAGGSGVLSPGTSDVTDNQGNTYTRRSLGYNASSISSAAIFTAIAATVGDPFTITYDPNASNTFCTASVVALEASGFDTGSPFDQADGGSGSSTAVQIALPTTAFADDLVIATCTWRGGGTNLDTPLTDYSRIASEQRNNDSSQGHLGVSRQVGATGIYTPGWTFSVSKQFSIAAVAIRGLAPGKALPARRSPRHIVLPRFLSH